MPGDGSGQNLAWESEPDLKAQKPSG